MARPKKNNADYFTHDADMRNDIKVKALRRRFSHMGYAVWNYLLETLTDSDFFEVERSDINLELLAADYDVTLDALNEIIDYCLKIELLQTEAGKIFSSSHKQRLAPLIADRARKRAIYNQSSGETATGTVSPAANAEEDSFSEVSPRRNGYSKGKERKEEESNVNNISLSLENKSDEAVAERERILEIFYFEKNCVDYFGETQRFIAHYEADGWCRKGNSTPVKDRVALARSWKVETPVNRTDPTLLSWQRKLYDRIKSENPTTARYIIRDIVHVKFLQPKDDIRQVGIMVRQPLLPTVINAAIEKWSDELRLPNCKIMYGVQK